VHKRGQDGHKYAKVIFQGLLKYRRESRAINNVVAQDLVTLPEHLNSPWI